MPRIHLDPAERVALVVYAALVAAMWPLPLLGLLHAESSAVIAGAAFFTAGLVALRQFAAGRRPPAVIARALSLVMVSAVLLTLSLLWRANCGYIEGLAFYTLFVPPATCLGVALAWTLSAGRVRRRGLAFIPIGVVASIAPVLLGPGLNPQFFVYSGVWGGVMGPIYDEELLIRPGLLAHRAVVMLWIAWLLALGTWLRNRERWTAITGAVLSVAHVVAYLQAPALGIVTTRTVLERTLAGSHRSGQFVIHHEAGSLGAHELRVIGETLRYRAGRYADVLGASPREPVHVYVFADAERRAALTGARYTSIAPVWLREPQIHVVRDVVTPQVLAHELVHVVAREFGMPGLGASPAVGLVEGVAVALEPPSGLPSLSDQVSAARALTAADAGRLSAGPSRAVVASMGPFGFWTGRGGVSYVTSGAFVGWLIERYGAAAFRQAYRCGDFSEAYGRDVGQLAEEWEHDLEGVPVTREALALARWQFSQPSLLERRCPHYVRQEERLVREGVRAREAGRAADAERHFRQAVEANASYTPAVTAWAGVALGRGRDPQLVASRLQRAATHEADAGLLAMLADARRLSGDAAGARRVYRAALAALPPYDHASRASLRLRATLAQESVRLVHTAGRHSHVARALEARADSTSGAEWTFAAERWLAAGRPTRALAAIRAMPVPTDPRDRAALFAARARYSRLAGLPRDAAREASVAASAYAAAGMDAPARQQRDRADEALWVASVAEDAER